MIEDELRDTDVEAFEDIHNVLDSSLPDGVAAARLVPLAEVNAKVDAYHQLPAKHRPSSPVGLALPVLRFGSETDSVWDPAISPKPFELDYLDGPLGYRIARAEGDSSPLRKALPRARDTSNKILWDLCGGWRVDALLMAHWGFEVHSFEKSPWVHLFSKRALERSRLVPEKELLLSLTLGDAREALESLPLTQGPRPSIIYIDPMYPQLGTSALNQAEMRYLHKISANADSADELLAAARTIALDQVIVKRPQKAPGLSLSPQHEIIHGSTRFEIYLPLGDSHL